ncbi:MULTISPECIES: NAD(P)/FAD-dependent oxidoreductase [Mesobacillus]|uniref:Sulfide:quinone oxidoreductase n=1 Tax=Mesobacillus stamsii TaxID=225347 RepID=A0ABU0FU67_9BACI|nr:MULTISPECIES: FAD/NAD(P)-binding oxidoreductase [Mesobacillus]MDQ0413340.1 sulfide:quinone oxidoreductase [Mesobacillus stamsii]
MKSEFKVVIIGGGTGGISVASRLLRNLPALKGEIAIIDPSEFHYYQPLWTLVGAGVSDKEVTKRTMESVIPDGVVWKKEEVVDIIPEENHLNTKNGSVIKYSYLVVAAGIEIHWDGVKGLRDALGKNGVTSNYSYQHADYTWELIRTFKGGNAVFTHPATPVKCGGAPQKIMYLADDYFNKTGVRNQTNVIFGSANPAIFDVDVYRIALEKVIERKKIDARFRKSLVEIRANEKEAVFEDLDTKEQEVVPYEMIHVSPPMRSPQFIRENAISDDNGWVDVHKYTLQHSRFENIFGLGDCSNLPTSKTGAAIRKQAPVVAENVISLMKGEMLEAAYNGYTSCPLVTGYKKLILAEFDYDKNPMETMPFNQAKERHSMYILKKDFLPILYWDGMLKGTM